MEVKVDLEPWPAFDALMQQWLESVRPKFEDLTDVTLQAAIDRVGEQTENTGLFIAVGKTNVDNLLTLKHFVPAAAGELLGSYNNVPVVQQHSHSQNSIHVIEYSTSGAFSLTGRASVMYTNP